MPAVAILGLIQAAAQLLPELAAVMPAVEAGLAGTATDADVSALQSATDALNGQAAAAEAAAGASGPAS